MCRPALRWYDSRDGWEHLAFASIVAGLIGLVTRGGSNPAMVFGDVREFTIPLAGGGVIVLAVVRVAGSQTVYGWVEQTGGLKLYAAASAPVVGLTLYSAAALGQAPMLNAAYTLGLPAAGLMVLFVKLVEP
jgi:hypothetical protein